ncbi:39S ribosomal protein L42, mitochondrial [Bombus vosnesenskii]|uniref:Large ribosomal subunit protein mL42 n=1 Tax=Bombus vosnesenskii TaxID=207650 RepID=A0A6J3L5C8_9HYME|nr:39S ribosomal protein L42, mitochondrial [Bombus vosnesenskii]XP_033360480.1 39S ribosomal protein L42, mitochondrial [Bombus vosnesenskii]
MNTVLSTVRVLNVSAKRYLSSVKLPSEIAIPMNNDMIICWHPEREFPYEYSLPLPEEKQISSNSVLCIGEKEIAEVFKQKKEEVVVEELSKLTYTTKHRWYPKNWRRRLRKVETERPYL